MTKISICSIWKENQKKSIKTLVAPSWMKIGTDNDTSGICPVFEMFNHASDGENNAFFEFDRINKKLFVGTNKKRGKIPMKPQLI